MSTPNCQTTPAPAIATLFAGAGVAGAAALTVTGLPAIAAVVLIVWLAAAAVVLAAGRH